ncbi:hypothetical protein H1P_440026 [Hyella patelloides LEGE 07179]|uniref:Uncharacterized protein n=1 Tax=Hyella patelloides LEGE 07179 TaxID=945734 RepID=A0A563VY33_9CYAN|nr:hypothetical protein H1P_440026 [Hyella patelloides LEGE 07179]
MPISDIYHLYRNEILQKMLYIKRNILGFFNIRTLMSVK